ncbi:MAG: rhomboid family intramembrane serine protease [Parachlamydiales bacterium]|nr:rhomboid family intramembrane serine protease [Parachlamydiales bacterium]
MYNRAGYRIGPHRTPLIIKSILFITIAISVISAVLAPFLKFNYVLYLLSLSLHGIKNFYFWQLITYNFIQPGFGLSISFAVHLFFNTYIIWIIGSAIIEKTSTKSFALLYFLSTLFSGLVMLLVMFLGYKYTMLASSGVGLYTCLIAWMMLNPPDTRIFLFFAIPLKLFWVVLALLGFNLFSNLSSLDMVHFFGYLSSAIFSYFFSIIVWNRHSPFKRLDKLERELIYFSRKIANRSNIKRKK